MSGPNKMRKFKQGEEIETIRTKHSYFINDIDEFCEDKISQSLPAWQFVRRIQGSSKFDKLIIFNESQRTVTRSNEMNTLNERELAK